MTIAPRTALAAALSVALACGGGGAPEDPCAAAAAVGPEDVSSPTTVVGAGTPASCTGEAFVAAVERGGVITFDCGPDPVTVTVPRTAKVFNDRGPRVVIDGGGKVTLSGGGATRILYMNTCDPAQVWTTPHCQDQDHPRLTVQNVTLVDGNAKGLEPEGGGGAIFARGGRLKLVNVRFFRNVCDDVGPDVGGGAVRAFDQHRDEPVFVLRSTFGGAEGANVCANGGALSSIGVSWTVVDGTFEGNRAVGWGANPARPGTPGGGSGGAVYADGNAMTLALCGVTMTANAAAEGGGAVFFVSNDRSGRVVVQDSVLSGNPSAGFETAGYPGVFVLAHGPPEVTRSTIE